MSKSYMVLSLKPRYYKWRITMIIFEKLRKYLCNNRGCFGGSPNATPMPTPAPQQADKAVKTAEDEERRRQREAASNTLLTGSQGSVMPKMQTKSLLGS